MPFGPQDGDTSKWRRERELGAGRPPASLEEADGGVRRLHQLVSVVVCRAATRRRDTTTSVKTREISKTDKEPLKNFSPINATRKLARILRVSFFRTLGINQRLERSKEHLLQKVNLCKHSRFMAFSRT